MPSCDFTLDILIEVCILVFSNFDLFSKVNSLASCSHPLKISFYWYKSQRAGIYKFCLSRSKDRVTLMNKYLTCSSVAIALDYILMPDNCVDIYFNLLDNHIAAKMVRSLGLDIPGCKL